MAAIEDGFYLVRGARLYRLELEAAEPFFEGVKTFEIPKWEVVPLTNADRIRAMTDEELAHFIDEFWSAPWCPDEPPIDSETKECMMHEGNCELCILDWLKQEVDDGTDP